jgi:hypothetical protein
MKTNLKKLPKSQMEIKFELDEQEFQKHIDSALLHLKEHIKIDGFRKGHVPKEIVKERISQENLLMEAGDLAVKESYLKYIKENNLEPIGEPEIQILNSRIINRRIINNTNNDTQIVYDKLLENLKTHSHIIDQCIIKKLIKNIPSFVTYDSPHIIISSPNIISKYHKLYPTTINSKFITPISSNIQSILSLFLL